MKLLFALNVLKKEYSVNKEMLLDKVSDKLQFLIALTVVEENLNNKTLTESEYRREVIGEAIGEVIGEAIGEAIGEV